LFLYIQSLILRLIFVILYLSVNKAITFCQAFSVDTNVQETIWTIYFLNAFSFPMIPYFPVKLLRQGVTTVLMDS